MDDTSRACKGDAAGNATSVTDEAIPEVDGIVEEEEEVLGEAVSGDATLTHCLPRIEWSNDDTGIEDADESGPSGAALRGAWCT